MKIVRQILYLSILLFFSYTLMNKVLIYDSFLLNISKTGLFSSSQVYVLSVLAISLEALSIGLLLFKKRVGLLFSVGMMSVFTLYTIALYLLGRYEVCGCGGIMNGLSFESHLLVNLTLLLVMVYLLKEDVEKERY